MLHEAGYTFNGDAPISGLREGEIAQIVLGRMVKNEQERKAAEEQKDGPRRKHSEPARSTDEAMSDYAEKHDLRSYQ